MAGPTKLTNAQIQQVWIANGGPKSAAPLMAAIAMAESGGNTGAHNTKAPDNSVGLWQVNYYGSLASSRTAKYGSPSTLLGDVNAQARAAIDIYKSQGLSAWSTYTSGSYRQFLTGAQTAPVPTTGGVTGAGTGGTPTPSSVTGGVVPSAADAAAAGALAGLAALPDQTAIYSDKCLISTPRVFGIGGSCLLSKAEGRVFLGAALMTAGGLITTVGVIILAAYGLQRSGAVGAASKATKAVGGVVSLVAPEAGVPIAAAGAAGERHDRKAREKREARGARRRQHQDQVRGRRERAEERGRERAVAAGPAPQPPASGTVES